MGRKAVGSILANKYTGFPGKYFKSIGSPYMAFRLKYPIVEKAIEPKKKDHLFDAGCQNGLYSLTIAQRYGTKVTGADLNKKALAEANEIAGKMKCNCKFMQGNLLKLPFKKAQFDKTICLDVIEHIKNDKKAVKEISRVTKKNGIVVITTPFKKSKFVMKIPNNKVGAVKGGHVREGYDKESFEKLFKGTDLEIEEIKYIGNVFGGISWFVHSMMKNKYLYFGMFPFLFALSKLDKILPFHISKEIILVKCKKIS